MKAQHFHYDILKVYNLSKLEEYREHRRLRVFAEKGCVCVECGIEGTIVALGKDKGGNLHLDVYTDDFYPLTVDHILPRSKGGSDELDNLQPMCCICNWSKGNGDKPANLGKRKYKYEEDIPKVDTLPKFNQFLYTKKNIQIGDIVYRKAGSRGNKIRKLGVVDKFCINPHTGKESLMIEGNNNSMYNLNCVYKIKEEEI